jgi:hypothetical protein
MKTLNEITDKEIIAEWRTHIDHIAYVAVGWGRDHKL